MRFTVKNVIHEVSLFLVLCVAMSASGQAQVQLSLKEAIEMSLRSNPDILRAEQEIKAADGRILQAGRIQNPELSFEWNEAPTNFDLSEADERDISISQSIEFPTRRGHRIDVATTEREIAALRLDRTKALVAGDVKRAYYQAKYSRQAITNLEEQLRLLDDFRSVIQSRYESGAVGYLDVIRTKIEIAQVVNELAEARREELRRQSEFRLLLGAATDQPIVLSDSLSQRPSPINSDSIITELMAKSATLKLRQGEIRRQDYALNLAKTAYFPDFTIGLAFQQRGEEPPFNANDFTGTTTNSVGLQLGLSIPLWFWKEPAGQTDEAGAMLAIARLNETRSARQVRSAISQAVAAAQVSGEQLRVFQTSLLIDIEDILETGMQQYRTNQLDLVNLFDIFRSTRKARSEYLRALVNYAIALADLEVAGELPFQD